MSKEKQIDIIIDLLTNFDEMGFAPTILVPDPEAYAIEWKKKLTDALQGYRKQSEWISVEERLPKEFESVLGFMTDAGDFPPVRECYLVGGVFFFPALRDRHPVSHWMPLPEAPKMKGGAE